jgi:hypothetical protein
MGRYVVIYAGLPSGDEPAGSVTAAWQQWFADLGAAVIDPGNPFGASRTVAADGTTTDSAPVTVTGYTILEAASLDAAAELVRECPGLANGEIAVYEALPFG